MADLFPGRNSMVQWKGKKIQIQTQVHMEYEPPEIGTDVIKDGQVIKRKTTPISDILSQPDSQKKIDELIQKQHNDVYMSIDQKAKQRMAEERKIQEHVEQQRKAQTAPIAATETKGEPGKFKSMLTGLFGKRKKG